MTSFSHKSDDLIGWADPLRITLLVPSELISSTSTLPEKSNVLSSFNFYYYNIYIYTGDIKTCVNDGCVDSK